MTTRYFALIVLSVTVHFSGTSQNMISLDFNRHIIGEKAITDSVYHIETNYPTTGIVAEIDENDSFDGAFFVVNKDTLYLMENMEREAPEGKKFSNLFTFGGYTDEFLFYPGNIRKEVRFYLIDAQLNKVTTAPKVVKKKSAGCSEPEMIDQSVWRAGLPEPDYERIVHKVHNIIIHHSAGSNTDTNYINVVRNIYIFHTEAPDAGRGWSDIGYNYLIAQDGTIFKGRDPGIYEQDNVKGAHFCGANTGTMGICVLGNYMDVIPPEEAVSSLDKLLTWKLGKDSLDPLGIYPHILNATLPVIAGHRDGCATLCPGDLLYAELEDIRQNVMDEFTVCGYTINPVIGLQSIHGKEISISYEHHAIIISYENAAPSGIRITDISGREFCPDYQTEGDGYTEIPFRASQPGIYFIHFQMNEKHIVTKLMLFP
jgi:hypothetical protein